MFRSRVGRRCLVSANDSAENILPWDTDYSLLSTWHSCCSATHAKRCVLRQGHGSTSRPLDLGLCPRSVIDPNYLSPDLAIESAHRVPSLTDDFDMVSKLDLV